MRANKPETLAQVARRLNAAGWRSCKAFYVNGGKFNCARVRRGTLEIGMCQRDWRAVTVRDVAHV